ncbi:hypothetical protein [Deinococcus petrolearius]|uniref:Uncharacterized protein n=1 Tax=Deinococcus petrolearius TaxID=1751295 RepID=A0ABW1DHS8_9DEIO
MPQPTYLRAICTVPLAAGADPHDPRLWERVFAGWRLDAPRGAGGALTPEVERAVALVVQRDQAEVRSGLLAYATWPQSPARLPALVNTLDGGRFVTVRIFGAHLTEVQDRAEAAVKDMLREPAFAFVPGTRVALAISVDGARVDLTSGLVRAGRGGALRDFYRRNQAALNVTLGVLVLTLLVVVLVTPAAPYTPLGKAYGLAERILSAVLLNVLLLASQFVFFARHRHVIEWERP